MAGMHLIDSHCHLDFADFDHDRGEVLRRCREQGVQQIFVPAVKARTFDRVVKLCEAEQGLFPALGLHPVFIDQHHENDLALLRQRIETDQPIAVGEIGLDYFLKNLDKQKQQHFFEQQVGIARDANLPVILHVRKAHDQVLQTLKRIRVSGGIAHAFNGTLQHAHHYIELGFKLGFGGMITYQRSVKLRRLARELPLEAIVLETDAPDMTPSTYQGERNSPEYLLHCLAALAEIRAEPEAHIAAQTTQNLLDLFNLQSSG